MTIYSTWSAPAFFGGPVSIALYPEGNNLGSTEQGVITTLLGGWSTIAPTVVASSDIASTSFNWDIYDALVVQFAASSTAGGGSTATAGHLKRINGTDGLPLYLTLGGFAESTGIVSSYTPEYWGAHESLRNVNAVEVQVTSSSTHPLLDQLSSGSTTGIHAISTGALDTMPLASSASYIGTFGFSLGVHTSTMSTGLSTAGQPALIAIEQGAPLLVSSSEDTGARIAGVAPWYDADWSTSGGQFFFGKVMDWVTGAAPLPPTLATSAASTTVTITPSTYAHINLGSFPQQYRRYQVDVSTGSFGSTSVFYDSGFSTSLGARTVSGLTPNTTGYKARVQDGDQADNIGLWSTVATFDTASSTAGVFFLSAGLKVDYESSTGVISSFEYLTASTAWTSVIEEAVLIPAGTTKITATAIKRGSASGSADVKWAMIEAGDIVAGYHPSPYISSPPGSTVGSSTGGGGSTGGSTDYWQLE